MKRYAFVYVIAGSVTAACAAVIVILRMPKDGAKPAEAAKLTENYAEKREQLFFQASPQ